MVGRWNTGLFSFFPLFYPLFHFFLLFSPVSTVFSCFPFLSLFLLVFNVFFSLFSLFFQTFSSFFSVLGFPQIPCLHDDLTNKRHETQPHNDRAPTLTGSHPCVLAGHPQHTGAWFAREAVDGPTSPQTTSDRTRPLRPVKTTFIKIHFHQKTTFIRKPLSSKKTLSSKIPLKGRTKHAWDGKNNIVRISVKASPAEGP